MYSSSSQTGAADTRRRAKRSPMELLVNLIEAEPTASKERLWNQWWAAVSADDEYLHAVGRHTFTNLYEATERDRRKTKSQPRAKPDPTVDKARAEALARRVVAAVLLEVTLPTNGKRLKDSTFADCARAGGWFSTVAKMGQPKQVVGDIVTEEQLRAIKFGK